MSNSLFPTSTQLPGTDIKIVRTPIWDTIVQQSVSGKETRIARRIYPRRTYELQFNFLRSSTLAPFNPVSNELATLEGFFNNRQGMYDSFLFTDPENYTTVNQSLGTGNGTNTQFQLVTTFGGFVEPVYAPTTNTVVVYKTDWQGTQLQYTTPRTNLVADSQNFSSNWSDDNVTVTSATYTAPDGTASASLLTNSTGAPGNGANVLASPGSLSTAATYTISAYRQSQSTGASQWGRLLLTNSGGTAYCEVWFDFLNGVIGTNAVSNATLVASSIQAVGSFYRCSVTANSFTDLSTARYFITSDSSNGASLGSSGATWVLWGVQLEQSSMTTPYIKTSSTSATVTDVSYTGWPSSSPGLITFAIAPVSGATITTNMSYNFPVRFTQDDMNFTRFVNLIYEGKKLEFETII